MNVTLISLLYMYMCGYVCSGLNGLMQSYIKTIDNDSILYH